MKFLKKAKYIKYTRAELEKYIKDKSSCVQKIHAHEHLGISMAGLQNLRETISRILDSKIGRYDRNRDGIVLDIRNTKVLNTPSLIRHDSADLHLDIEADFYVFRPRIGAVIVGVVKHISQANIGVVIYRVFNVAVKFSEARHVKVNQEIKIRVMNFDLDNRMPEIEGELVGAKMEENDGDSGISTEGVTIKLERDSDEGASTSKRVNGEDLESFVKPKKRRSILIRQENVRRSSISKHVSFNETPITIKLESESSDDDEREKKPPRKNPRERSRSPPPPPPLDETSEFNEFEEQMENGLHSTQIASESLVPVKTEKSHKKSGKKRKRETDDESEESQTKNKKKKRKELVEVKIEPNESSSSLDTPTKKKKKKKDKRNSFHDRLSSVLDEVEMSTTQETVRAKVPKIKKEKL